MTVKKATIKQKLFARTYVKTGNATKAAMTVYDTKRRVNAKQIGARLLKKEVVQQEIKAVLMKAGLTLDQGADYLHTAITRGLEGKATVGDALRGLDMAFKLHGSYPASRSIKLAYTKHEQVASKDLQQTVNDLKKITERATSLIESIQ